MTEYEAKFLIQRPDQVDQVLSTLDHLGFQVSEGKTSTHIDRYFDTADWSILQAGWAYRCRKRNKEEKLVLKSLGSKNGAVFERDEIEQILPRKAAKKKGRLPGGPVQEQITRLAKDKPRRELFRVKNRRTVFDIVRPGEDPAHLVLDLDRTHIRAEKAKKKALGHVEFVELELESDEADVINTLAEILRERHGLVPAQLSKFERGLQTAGLTIPADRSQLCNKRLKGGAPVLDLVYQYLGRQLVALQRHYPRAWEGLDPSGVHKMRIAIRRTRSVLKAFRSGLPEGPRELLNIELRWLLKQLGHARDADVCGAEIERYRAALHGVPNSALAPYETHLTMTTLGAHTNLVDALASDRYEQLIRQFGAFLAAGSDATTQSELGEMSISDCEREFIPAAIEKMLQHGKKITPESPAKRLHRLRLKAKRLRYLLELFATAKPKKFRAPIAALSELQELLGEHQDAITAHDKLAAYAETLPVDEDHRDQLLAVGRLMQLEDERAFECRQRFPACWNRFKHIVT